MWHAFLYYFGLPYGQVWPNILALIPTGGFAYVKWAAHREETRRHQRRVEKHLGIEPPQ